MKHLSFFKKDLRSSLYPVSLGLTAAPYITVQTTAGASSIGVDVSGDGPDVDDWVLAPAETAGGGSASKLEPCQHPRR